MCCMSMTPHDNRVEQLANYYRNQGWKVWAHLQGWTTPNFESMDKIPDLFVEKSGYKSRLIEVETKESVDELHAKTQKITFKLFSITNNYEFELIIV